MTRGAKPKAAKSKIFNLRWILLFVVVCGVSFGSQVVTIWEMRQEIKNLNLKKSELIQKNREYRAGVRAMNSNETLEKLAREELGMIKPGEKLLVEVLPQE